eukprot:1375045-Pyramimonas_sp.AAC.1
MADSSITAAFQSHRIDSKLGRLEGLASFMKTEDQTKEGRAPRAPGFFSSTPAASAISFSARSARSWWDEVRRDWVAGPSPR